MAAGHALPDLRQPEPAHEDLPGSGDLMVNRIQPQGRVVDYKTYQITQPKTAHTRLGSCEAADCENYANGWRTVIDVTPPGLAAGRTSASFRRRSV